MAEEELSGGGVNRVTRDGDIVYRSRNEFSASVERVLQALAEAGFTEVPRFLGISPDGRQMLSFQPGTSGIDPLSSDLRSDEALASAARLLRRFHDATATLRVDADQPWMLPAHEPVEVLCHGDFAPYNLVFQGRTATALIDLDTIHPGPRERDVAYALYRFAPLMADTNVLSQGTLVAKGARARAFCDEYGLPTAARRGIIATAAARLVELVEFMRTEAAAGNAAFQRHLTEGHAESYLTDVQFLRDHQAELTRALVSDLG